MEQGWGIRITCDMPNRTAKFEGLKKLSIEMPRCLESAIYPALLLSMFLVAASGIVSVTG